MTISRRHFLQSGSAVTVGFLGLQQFVRQSTGEQNSAQSAEGYGPLVADSKKALDLPAGFSYSIISTRGDEMEDGFLVPAAADGMAAFTGSEGETILIRNHELNPDQGGPFGANNARLSKIDAAKLYDSGKQKTPSQGGTTTVVFDTKKQQVIRQFLSLAGTTRNCAGGPTPWGSWISCEETVVRAGFDAKKRIFSERDHGYVFEVPATSEIKLAQPTPITGMGRFNHEAIAVDAESGVVYETEDRPDGLIYRYVPKQPGHLLAGGKLQALAISGHPSLDTRNWNREEKPIAVGKRFAVKWIDMDDVHSPGDDLRARGFKLGAAKFARGEGMWYDKGAIFFACTNGGLAEKGQIWKYLPSKDEGSAGEKSSPGELELFIEPNDGNLVSNCDNLTVAPWGDLIVCEDTKGTCRLIGVTPEGKLYEFARNHYNTEFAGVTFSPDGSTLFVNMQGRGLTVAIAGPWENRADG